jgi:hypothetical protein
MIAIVGVVASFLGVPAESERLPMAAAVPDRTTIDAAAPGAAPLH